MRTKKKYNWMNETGTCPIMGIPFMNLGIPSPNEGSIWQKMVKEIYRLPTGNYSFNDEILKQNVDALRQNEKVDTYIKRALTYGISIHGQGHDKSFQNYVDICHLFAQDVIKKKLRLAKRALQESKEDDLPSYLVNIGSKSIQECDDHDDNPSSDISQIKLKRQKLKKKFTKKISQRKSTNKVDEESKESETDSPSKKEDEA